MTEITKGWKEWTAEERAQIECSFKNEKCEGEVTQYRLCEFHKNDYSEDAREPHQCHFCGEWVLKGFEYSGRRHYLSDCRPDLVEHKPGPTCTWHGCERRNEDGDLELIKPDCYAYAEDTKNGRVWGDEHKHFHTDGPM